MKSSSSFKIENLIARTIPGSPKERDVIIYEQDKRLYLGRYFEAEDLIFVMPLNAPYEATIISNQSILSRAEVIQ